MSPPSVPGYPGAALPDPGASLPAQLNALTVRVGQVEAHTGQLVADMAGVKESLGRFHVYEAAIRGLITRGILLVIGAVGGTYGVTRMTTPPPQKERVEVIKSKTTVQVEACTAMQPGPERDRCAIKILGDLMGSGR